MGGSARSAKPIVGCHTVSCNNSVVLAMRAILWIYVNRFVVLDYSQSRARVARVKLSRCFTPTSCALAVRNATNSRAVAFDF